MVYWAIIDNPFRSRDIRPTDDLFLPEITKRDSALHILSTQFSALLRMGAWSETGMASPAPFTAIATQPLCAPYARVEQSGRYY